MGQDETLRFLAEHFPNVYSARDLEKEGLGSASAVQRHLNKLYAQREIINPYEEGKYQYRYKPSDVEREKRALAERNAAISSDVNRLWKSAGELNAAIDNRLEGDKVAPFRAGLIALILAIASWLGNLFLNPSDMTSRNITSGLTFLTAILLLWTRYRSSRRELSFRQLTNKYRF